MIKKTYTTTDGQTFEALWRAQRHEAKNALKHFLDEKLTKHFIPAPGADLACYSAQQVLVLLTEAAPRVLELANACQVSSKVEYDREDVRLFVLAHLFDLKDAGAFTRDFVDELTDALMRDLVATDTPLSHTSIVYPSLYDAACAEFNGG